jgi:hypothetical protein
MGNERSASDRPKLFLSVRMLVGLAWLWFLAAMVFLTDPGCDFRVFLLVGFSGFFIGIMWLVMTILNRSLIFGTVPKRWLSVPLAGILAQLFLVTDWGITLRVRSCEGQLNSYVASVPAGTDDQTPRWIGLFRIEETVEHDGAVYLYTGHPFIDRAGVAYIPPGTKLAGGIRADRRLHGDWYSFIWKF